MINYKRLISASILLTVTGLAVAQTSTNSPYTRYGFGQLADQNFGNSKAMGGIAYGLRNGYQINVINKFACKQFQYRAALQVLLMSPCVILKKVIVV